MIRFNGKVFRLRPDDAPFAVVAERLLGNLYGLTEVEEILHLLVGQVDDTASLHSHLLYDAQFAGPGGEKLRPAFSNEHVLFQMDGTFLGSHFGLKGEDHSGSMHRFLDFI